MKEGVSKCMSGCVNIYMYKKDWNRHLSLKNINMNRMEKTCCFFGLLPISHPCTLTDAAQSPRRLVTSSSLRNRMRMPVDRDRS